MARLLVDGFETGDFSQWDFFRSSLGEPMDIVSSGAYSGQYCVKNDNLYHSYYAKYLYLTSGVLYGGFWHKWSYYAGGYGDFGYLISMLVTGGPNAWQTGIYFRGTTGAISIVRGGSYEGTTLVTSADRVIPIDTWNHIQFAIKIHPTEGYAKVRVNGDETLAIDATNLNTRADTTNEIRYAMVGFDTRTNAFNTCWWDDVIFDDAEMPGMSRVIRMPISGPGSLTQWTPSAGANWQCVDEVPASDSDYIQSEILEVIDVYEISDLVPGASINIKSVTELVRAYNDGTSASEYLGRVLPIICSGTTVNIQSDSSEVLALVPSRMLTRIWEINPFTNLPFTLSELNALQFGVKVTEFYRSFNTLSSNQSLNLTVRPFGLTAIWEFESGALTSDELDRNNLSASVSSPTVFTEYFKSGSACANFVNTSSQMFYINDSDLSEDFPLKYGDTVKQISILCWVNLDSSGGGGGKIFSKGNLPTGHYGINFYVAVNLLWLGFGVGTPGSETSQAIGTGISISYQAWHHIALVVDGVSKTIYVRVYHDATGVTDTYSTTLDDELVINNDPVMIGCESSLNSLFFYDGKIDGMKVFNRCLGADEIDSLR